MSSVGSRRCVSCGRQAAAYCAGCGVTPYCGERCQRRDWPERHRAVCHNLARLSGSKGREYDDENDQVEDYIPPAAPLRPPHAAPAQRREQMRDDESGSGSDKNVRKYNSKPDNKNNNRLPRNNFTNKRPQGDMRRPNVKPNAGAQDDEDWGPKDEKTPEPAPIPSPVKAQKPPTFNKLYDEAPTYKSTKNVEPKREQVPETAKPVVQATSPVVKQVVKETAPAVKQPVAETTPVKLVPERYLIGTLNIGDSAVLSVDALASACRSARGGFVCLSMNERYEADYQLLCESFGEACAANTDEYRPVPGSACSYLDPSDGGWYRARCVSRDSLALLDASRLVQYSAADRCGPLPPQYGAVPEFCCLLIADAVQVGMSLTCQLVSKTAEGWRVSVLDNDSGADLGAGDVLRWTPKVDFPTPGPAATIPEVIRPEVANNSRVLLVHATAMDKTYVRLADVDSQRKYDDVLERVALCGRSESPLSEPPSKGQTVLGQFEDGLHYRALCKRTNIKQNKYLLEYIDFGNMEVSPLEKLFPCPRELDLSSEPALVARVALDDSDVEFTPPALEYVERLKQGNEEVILTVASGSKTAASGSVVNLTLAKNKENINMKLQDMCTPEWKKIEQRGGDVIETKRLMYSDLEWVELPSGGCTVDVLDASMLQGGILSACPRALPHAAYVLGPLTQKMAEYCNSEIGRQPYLPKPEELCIAQYPPYPQWFRAVLAAQVSGAGGAAARVCYLDYGNVAAVPVSLLRKMLPEFVLGLPVLASHLMIKDFPANPTAAMLARAREFMRIDDEGRGSLRLRRCTRQEDDVFLVDAPDLVAYVCGN